MDCSIIGTAGDLLNRSLAVRSLSLRTFVNVWDVKCVCVGMPFCLLARDSLYLV
jgi:hypothetical protein